MSERDVVIRVEGVSKLYRLGEVGTGSLAHDVNRWWHRVRGKEDPYLKIGEVNDRTKPAKQARTDGGSQRTDGTTKGTKAHENLTTDCSDGHGYGTSGGNQRADSGEFLEGHSQAGLQMDSEKLAAICSANAASGSGDQTGNAASVLISDISGKKSSALATSYPPPVTPKAPPSDWVYALKDVSFEVKRGEVLGIIGRNGAGNQAAGQPLERLPKAARSVRRPGASESTCIALECMLGLPSPSQRIWSLNRGVRRVEIGGGRQALRALRFGKSANQILIVHKVLAVASRS